MRVDVYSKYHAAEIEPRPRTVVISIGSPGESYELKEGWDDILRIEFDDVVKIPTGMTGHNIIAFSIEHAEILHEFIESYIESDFMIHCSAGVSRSVAVGSFMREVHGADLNLHETHSDEHCNSRVRRGLMNKYWRAQFSK
ncbi:hypothetical protein LCGC14_0243870 [marine sediment metagenome]|uniref:Tyrosine specific protein phosphatases domain-containing protein n=1 Tax=marine sediment metagenome TaxID=412755 RepID=A0A0F9U6H0_9ZZZZ